MKVAELLERRRVNWQELETLCERADGSLSANEATRFSTLYRAVCADLALAESHHLPANTVQYLNRLVARANNRLYRAGRVDWDKVVDLLFKQVPRTVLTDRCIQIGFALFWGTFFLSAFLAYPGDSGRKYSAGVVGEAEIQNMEKMYNEPISDSSGLSRRGAGGDAQMGGFYVYNNAGWGLRAFAGGMLIIPGLLIVARNGVVLGAVFGHMARPDCAQGQNFFDFVTAHGPFELTAIALAGGAGLRVGMSWIAPGELSRSDSVRKAAADMLPVIGVATALFFGAAMIEGFVSPSGLPNWLKLAVATISSALLTWYFVVMGWPEESHAA